MATPRNGAPGGGENRQGANDDSSVENSEFTRRAKDSKGPHPSGHHDTRKPDGRVKRRAEDLARREVGDPTDWEAFTAEAEGDLRWENYEAYLARLGWQRAGIFPYLNPNSSLLYEALRYNYVLMPTKKIFKLRHRINGPWIHGAGPVRVPYNLPELLRRADEDIILVEGEKGVDRLKPLLGSCVQGQNWTSDVVQLYTGRNVIIAMDNDDAGRKNEEEARYWLSKVNATIRVPEFPEMKPGDGLDD